MRLKWYGHASFRVTADDGTAIVTDPYTPETSGYKPVNEIADIVAVSTTTDSYHCRADLIPGNPEVVDTVALAKKGEARTVRGIPFSAVSSLEALAHRDGNPEDNALYRFIVDGISIGHMGDVGNPLDETQTAFFRGVDILLALTGGYPTIALDDLMTAIDVIQPKLIVPMHFRTLRCTLYDILWLPSFLDYFDKTGVAFAHDCEVEITPGVLDSSRVLVLDYM